MPRDVLAQHRERLSIDRTDLDQCLIEQPEVFWHVAEALAQEIARRDEAKLELEELTAQLDQDLRGQAARNEEKLTELALQNRLRVLPKIQEAQRKYLERRKTADQLQALKEAFQQRSFMLRELVAKFIAERHDLGMEAGAGQARRTLVGAQADDIRERAGKMRIARRKGIA